MNGLCWIHIALWTFQHLILAKCLCHCKVFFFLCKSFHCKHLLPGFYTALWQYTTTIKYLIMRNKTVAVFVFSFLFMIDCVGIQCLSGEISSFLSFLHAVPSCTRARKDISLRVSTKMCINTPHISPLSQAVSREGRPQEVNEWSRCLARAECQLSPWYPKTNGFPVALNATFLFFLSKDSGADQTYLKEYISQLRYSYAFCVRDQCL